jgi:phosphopantothenate synthetase
MLCDFGMSRALPNLSQEEKELREARREKYRQVTDSKDKKERSSRY